MGTISKEEILKKHTNLSVDPKYSNNGDILDAMDEYAKQKAIDFASFMASKFHTGEKKQLSEWYEMFIHTQSTTDKTNEL